MNVTRIGISIIIGFTMALFGTSAWFLFFGYQPKFTATENLQLALSVSSFWLAVLIWTVLYSFAVALPLISLIGHRKKEE